GWEVSFNCIPAASGRPGFDTERVAVACPKTPEAWKEKPLMKGTWLEALCLSTTELLKEGRSAPPAQETVDFLRSADALSPRPVPRRAPGRSRLCRARYAITPKVRPSVTDAVPLAERVRSYLMGIHKRICGDDPTAVSPMFSGKERDGSPAAGHGHAFYIPLDEDRDGRIDHLEIWAGRPFEPNELLALDALHSVHHPKRPEGVDLVLVNLMADMRPLASRKWVSETPMVLSRHHRKGRGPYEEWIQAEIARECLFHGLPEPESVHPVPGIIRKGKSLRWMQFVRSRKGQSPKPGMGFELTFAQPVQGPFALGSLCHYGLGLFLPTGEGA
ncbi:MAG: type I-U CRISPR-associated protein Csb2, partial [Pseudomonadota bacterium]